METSSVARKWTGRFIAGQNLEDCLEVAARLAASGFRSSLDHLGENVSSAAEADQARACYEQALHALSGMDLGATISVKLTQLGLDLSQELCFDHARRLCLRAAEAGSRVEFDMESSEYTDRTLAIVERLHAETGCVRAVVQAYLYRTEQDIERLNRLRVPVRLCKGAYSEGPSVAFPSKADVDRNYVRLTELLLDGGADPALATHDPAMIEAAKQHARRTGRSSDAYEFQMLYGVRRDLQEQLRASGYRVRLYVPYGDAWYPYFMRRLAERPANAIFILKNLFRH